MIHVSSRPARAYDDRELVPRAQRRAAVCLRGAHASVAGYGPLDWPRTVHSLLDAYVEPRRLAGWAVEIFYHTHRSNHSAALLELLVPSLSSEEPVKGNPQWRSGLAALKLLLARGDTFDEVLFTRFDLLYKQPVSAWNLSTTAFNAPFRHPEGHLSDVFYVFPGSLVARLVHYLQEILRERVCDQWTGSCLHVKEFPFPVHTMVSRPYYSDTDWPQFFPLNCNPLYVLWRRRRWGGLQDAASAWREARRQQRQNAHMHKVVHEQGHTMSRSFIRNNPVAEVCISATNLLSNRTDLGRGRQHTESTVLGRQKQRGRRRKSALV